MKNHLRNLFDNVRTKADGMYSRKNSDKSQSDKKLVSSLRGIGLSPFRKLKFLNKVLSAKELRTVRLLAAVMAVSLAVALGTFYFKNFTVVPITGGEYVEGLVGSPEFINPLLSQTNDVDADISKLVFSGLMRFDKNLALQPDLAEKFEISEDQKTYTFTLRTDVVWHDGEPFDADDVLFTYQSIQDPDFKSPLNVSLKGIDVEKISATQIQFILNEQYPAFLEILTAGILPEHIWSGIPPLNANLTEYNIKPIGSGSWRFKSLSKDRLGNIKSYTLEPFEEYYGKLPYLKKITFKFYPNFESATAALNNRSIEGLSFLPKGLETQVQNAHAALYSFYLPQYTALFFNQKNNEALEQKTVRKALALGIDKTKILTEALRLKGEIIDSPILPGFLGFHSDVEKFSYDPASAAEEIASAGWEKITSEEYDQLLAQKIEEEKEEQQHSETKKEEVPTSTLEEIEVAEEEIPEEPKQEFYLRSGDDIFEVTLTTVDLSENIKAAELIKEFWEALGVKVNIQTVADNRITREIIKPREFEILLFGVIVGADPDPYPFWHSSQIQDPGLNLSNFANRKVDGILEEARTTTDVEKRIELYKEFQDIIAAEIPAIFLFNPTYTYVTHQKIQGIEMERITLPSDRFNNLADWYIKTGRRWKGGSRQ